MSPDTLEGKVNNGIGKAEAAVGEVVGDPGLQARGEVRQFEGKAQAGAAQARDRMAEAATRAKSVFADAADQAADAYQAMKVRAQSFADTVDPMVKERPYAALGVGVAIGLIVGAIMFAAGPKVVYVRPSRT
jgi:ElaB/YqjD/DUF883 family membrane-anchored ribosome-binding protein